MDTPRLEVSLEKVFYNTRTIVEMCKSKGVEVVGVVKGVSGMPQVAKMMLEGGATCIADARIKNIKKLKEIGITSKIMLLRLPRFSGISEVVKNTDISLNSEKRVIRKLAREGSLVGKQHSIIIMVDVGDLREGIMYTRALEGVKHILNIKGVDYLGIGTNVGCYGGVIPTEENMGKLSRIVNEIRKQYSIHLEVVSVGGTNCLELIKNGKMPSEINQVRVGEGILLGYDGTRGMPLENTYQDAFQLVTEIVEIKKKPSKPIGSIGRDAFGKKPAIKDRGIRTRALIALGKQDVRLSGLKPIDKNIKVLGGSSDYTILDISDSDVQYKLGSEVHFNLSYEGLLSATTSPYVKTEFKEGIYEYQRKSN